VTSQGQRFRRRALRRGYKVDEVDAFLDRVEATLQGEPIGAPVTAQEVHDVVFRVRFGGYDEWQVDLHLDRVERQLGDLEERTGGFARQGASRPAMRDEPAEIRRSPIPGPPMPTRPLTPVTQMAGGPMVGPGVMPPMMAPPMSAPPVRPMSAPPMRPMSAPPMRPMSAPPMRPMSGPPMGRPMVGPPAGGGYPRFDETDHGGGFGGGGGGEYAGRRGRVDLTHEMRFDLGGPTSGMPGGGPGAPHPGELQRIDAMRRTFTARRFGSGYDAIQVNRLFDAILASLSGRSGMPISEAELDPNQFSLVPGGYFEAEVNQALREVRDLVRR
jgi:DivIVA domain-containing protein